MISDTIAAIATPPGEGGVGIVRLSGPQAVAIAERFFAAGDGRALGAHEPRLLVHGRWQDPATQELIDECLCVRFAAPHSYTGEDVVEVHTHGGLYHLSDVLKRLLDHGARQALAGEFTQRAFVNGKLDLTRAEAVQDLVAAGAALSQKAALDQLSGGLFARADAIRQKVLGFSAQTEAALDHPEEAHQLLSGAELKLEARSVVAELAAWLATAGAGIRARQGARVVLAGRANVGKSSLLNALLKMERAIVTPQAGTTRDFIEEKIEIKGYPVVLIDTAGLRATSDEIEKEGVSRSLDQVGRADLCLFVLDGSVPVNEEDREALRVISAPVVLVLNKADLETQSEAVELRPEAPRCAVSARSGSGLRQLEELIVGELEKQGASQKVGAGLLTSVRHEQAVRRALKSMEHVAETLEKSEAQPELLAGDLRDVLDALGDLVGQTTRHEVVEEIFRRFCIGK